MTDQTIPCPCCKNPASLHKSNDYRPFCSKRCKDGDFIGWSEEENRIAGTPDFADLMSGELGDF